MRWKGRSGGEMEGESSEGRRDGGQNLGGDGGGRC